MATADIENYEGNDGQIYEVSSDTLDAFKKKHPNATKVDLRAGQDDTEDDDVEVDVPVDSPDIDEDEVGDNKFFEANGEKYEVEAGDIDAFKKKFPNAEETQIEFTVGPEKQGFGQRLKNKLNAYVNPFISKDERDLYKEGVDVGELKEDARVSDKAYVSQKDDLEKELDKAFTDNPQLFGQMIDNPSELNLTEREVEKIQNPSKYLKKIIK